MKKNLLLFLCCLALGIGFAQDNDRCTQRLEDAASAEKRSGYLTALRIYTSARNYCTGNTVDEKIEAMFKKIDGLRVAAERAEENAGTQRKMAEQEKLRSDSLAQEANTQREGAEREKQNAIAAQLRSDSLAQEANTQRQKAQAVLDKIYFYNDRFGLAYDKSEKHYGFIDKDLNTKIEFKYTEALPFDGTGFAKVKRDDENDVETDYLIDTLGTEYRVAYEVAQLSPAIEALDLRNQSLDKIPNVIFQHQQLKFLLLGSNKLTSLPTELGQLADLHSLNLSDNELTSLPAEIGQLANLQSLAVSFNKLTTLPAELGKLANLQSLTLQANRLTSLPAELGQLANLQTLYLWNNQLTSLPVELWQLANLQSLSLSKNQLTTLPVKLGRLANLQELDLVLNQLTTLPAELGQLANLQTLYLSFNQLTTLPAELGQLANLRSLYLHKNQLTTLPAEIGRLANLQTLYLSRNKLRTLPTEIRKLANLQSLYLQGNDNLPFDEVCTALSTSLKNIYIIANNDDISTPNEDPSVLQVVVNTLTDLPPAIQQIRNLKGLDLSECAISPAHQAEIKGWLPGVEVRFKQ